MVVPSFQGRKRRKNSGRPLGGRLANHQPRQGAKKSAGPAQGGSGMVSELCRGRPQHQAPALLQNYSHDV